MTRTRIAVASLMAVASNNKTSIGKVLHHLLESSQGNVHSLLVVQASKAQQSRMIRR